MGDDAGAVVWLCGGGGACVLGMGWGGGGMLEAGFGFIGYHPNLFRVTARGDRSVRGRPPHTHTPPPPPRRAGIRLGGLRR